MHPINIWNKLHLCRNKIVLVHLTLLLFFAPISAWAQPEHINLPRFNNRKLHYGAIFGFHSLSYNTRYSDAFLNDPTLDGLHSINPLSKVGVTMGFIFSVKLADNLYFRSNAQVAIYEHAVEYRYFNGADRVDDVQLIESVNAEFPLLLEFKSRRRKNFQAYLVGGFNPSLEASGKKKQQGSQEVLLTNGRNLTIEYGVGFDIFYPYFKFSPEIRFSHGLINVLKQEDNKYSRGLDRMTTHAVTLYLQFSG